MNRREKFIDWWLRGGPLGLHMTHTDSGFLVNLYTLRVYYPRCYQRWNVWRIYRMSYSTSQQPSVHS